MQGSISAGCVKIVLIVDQAFSTSFIVSEFLFPKGVWVLLKKLVLIHAKMRYRKTENFR